MNTHTQSTPENVKARLTLDVTCLLNGEAASEILARLQRMWVRAIGERLLIDETAAKVDVWSIEVTELPSAPNSDALESEIAAFMQQRIEDGNLGAEDIPLRLARYGLMAPEDFIDGFTPVFTDTYEKADLGHEECSCRSEGSSAPSSSVALLSRRGSRVSAVPKWRGSWGSGTPC